MQIATRMEGETVWLTINLMADLFQVDKPGISRHLKDFFESGELRRSQLLQNLQQFKPHQRRNH